MNLNDLAPRAEEAELFLKALANRHRLMILCLLHTGEHSVGALQKELDLSQSSLSQHLSQLRRDHLVSTRRQAQTIFYSLADTRVSEVIGQLYKIYCAPGLAKKPG